MRTETHAQRNAADVILSRMRQPGVPKDRTGGDCRGDGRRVYSDDNLRQQGVQTVRAHRWIYGDRGDGGGDGHAGSAGGSRS